MGDQEEHANNTPTQDGEPPQTPPQQPPTAPGTAPDKGGNDPAWLPDRLARAEESAVKKFLQSIGAESADDLKSRLTALQTFEEENQTALEHAQKQLDSETKKREAAEVKLADTQAKQRQFVVNTAVTTAAQSARAKQPGDVLLWAQSDENTIELDSLLDDDGNVVDKQVKALVEAAKKARPDWFRGDGPGSPSNSEGTAPEPDKDAREAARRRQHQRTRGAWN